MKPFLWESKANLETFQKLSSYIGFSYKFVLNSVKDRNGISRVIEYWFRVFNAKFSWGIQNHFPGKTRQTLELSKNFFHLLEFRVDLFWSLSKDQMECSEWLVIGSMLYNAKFGRRIQNRLSGKAKQTLKLFKNHFPVLEFPIYLKLSKNFFPILGFSINYFFSLPKV